MTQISKIVVSIATQKNPYYRSTAGRWTADINKAKEFSTTEEAQQEAEQLGTVTFLGEQCQPRVSYIETFSRRRQ